MGESIVTVFKLVQIRENLIIFLLSHLLIAGCDKKIRSPNFRSSIRLFVCTSVCQHLHQSFFFSTSVIAASLKSCILIVLDIPFKHAP